MRRRDAIRPFDNIKLRGVVCIVREVRWRDRCYSLEMLCGAKISNEPERNLRRPRKMPTCLLCIQHWEDHYAMV